ncbi:MAG: STAS domain-containing protein [Limnobacter sp.]|nr:STAS domain-containing protein [Limnobacter sp.]
MVSIEESDQVCVIKVDSVRLDSAVGTVIRNSVGSRLESHNKFVLDLTDVKLVDSGGLGSLVAILKNTSANKAHLVLAGMQKSVKLMFELSRMDRQFTLYPDVTSALQAVR